MIGSELVKRSPIRKKYFNYIWLGNKGYRIWTQKAGSSENARCEMCKSVLKLGNVGGMPFENHVKGKPANALWNNTHVFLWWAPLKGTWGWKVLKIQGILEELTWLKCRKIKGVFFFLTENESCETMNQNIWWKHMLSAIKIHLLQTHQKKKNFFVDDWVCIMYLAWLGLNYIDTTYDAT